MVHPTPNRLIRHRHSAFREQIFDVTQAEGKPEVEPYCLVNDLGRETIPAVADFLHPLGYSTTGRAATTTRRDNALAAVSWPWWAGPSHLANRFAGCQASAAWLDEIRR